MSLFAPAFDKKKTAIKFKTTKHIVKVLSSSVVSEGSELNFKVSFCFFILIHTSKHCSVCDKLFLQGEMKIMLYSLSQTLLRIRRKTDNSSEAFVFMQRLNLELNRT